MALEQLISPADKAVDAMSSARICYQFSVFNELVGDLPLEAAISLTSGKLLSLLNDTDTTL